MENKQEDEIRVSVGKSTSNYINRAAYLLLKSQSDQGGNNLNSVTFKASGQAIHTALSAALAIQQQIPQLHQISRISKIEVTQTGKNNQDYTKDLVVFEIVVTRNPTKQELSEPGYQPPFNTSSAAPKLDDIVNSHQRRVQDSNHNYHQQHQQQIDNNRNFGNNNNSQVKSYNFNNNNNERYQNNRRSQNQQQGRRENFNTQRHYNNNGSNNQQGGSRGGRKQSNN